MASTLSEAKVFLTTLFFSVILFVVLAVSKLAKPLVQFLLALFILPLVMILMIGERSEIANRLLVAEQSTQDAKEMADRLNDGLTIEEARRAGKDVWQVAIVENRAEQAIVYNVFNEDQTWQQRTLQPRQSEALWKKGIDITVRFNSAGNDKQYRIDARPVIGREPDQTERSRGPVNYFSKTTEGKIDLYSTRPGRPKKSG